MVNIADVNNPKEVAFIGAKEGSYPGEGIQAVHIDTTAFNGDILVSNNETCNEKTGFGGMNIYDVTNPRNPLAEGIGDFTVNGQGKKAANEIHSVFAWDAGNKALAGRESVSLKGGGASAPPPFRAEIRSRKPSCRVRVNANGTTQAATACLLVVVDSRFRGNDG